MKYIHATSLLSNIINSLVQSIKNHAKWCSPISTAWRVRSVLQEMCLWPRTAQATSATAGTYLLGPAPADTLVWPMQTGWHALRFCMQNSAPTALKTSATVFIRAKTSVTSGWKSPAQYKSSQTAPLRGACWWASERSLLSCRAHA